MLLPKRKKKVTDLAKPKKICWKRRTKQKFIARRADGRKGWVQATKVKDCKEGQKHCLKKEE